MKSTIVVILVLAAFISAISALAQNKAVVIPLNSAKKLHNVVTVSAHGGDFTDPVAAVNSIIGAGEQNPYLVLIGPGVYTLTRTLNMKPYVSITGSGQGATILTGTISNANMEDSAIVRGAGNATLSNLTIENKGGADAYSVAMYNFESSPVVQDVTIRVEGQTNNTGVYNHTSSPVMSNMTVEVLGGGTCRGMTNFNSSPTLRSIRITASAGSGENTGVSNYSSSVNMSDVYINAVGLANNYAVYVYDPSPPASSIAIRQSKIESNVYGIYVYSGTTTIIRSSVAGIVHIAGGTVTCVNSDNGLADLDSDCVPIP